MLKLSNNASGLLGSNLTAGATSLTLASGHGARFPTVSSGEWYPVTIVSAADPANFEIVRVTARNGDTLTISRAQEGTTAKAFSAGDVVELRMTAGAYDQGFAKLTDNNGAKGLQFSVADVPNGQTKTMTLRSASERDVTESQYDQTPNRLLKRGDGGWLGYGLTDAIAAGYPQTSVDNFTCVYRRGTVDQGVRAYASTLHFAGSSDTWGRLRISHSAPLAAWIQGGNSANGTGWTAELWHSGNFNPNDYLPSNPSVGTNFIQTPGSANAFELRTTVSADATTYLRGRHGSVNNWYIGKSAPSNDNVIFHSYIHNTQLFLGAGGITSNKDITAFSDERLKENWNTLPDNFVEQLALVKSGSYDRKDTGIRQVGVSAQSLQKVLPEAVIESEESPPEGEESKLDFEGPVLSVSYGNAALAAAVELAKTVVSLKEQVAALTEEVKSLKGGNNG